MDRQQNQGRTFGGSLRCFGAVEGIETIFGELERERERVIFSKWDSKFSRIFFGIVDVH